MWRRAGRSIGKKVLKWLPNAVKKLTKFKTKAGGPCDTDLTAIGLSPATVQSIASTVQIANAASANPAVYAQMEKQNADFGVLLNQNTNTIYYDQNYFWQNSMGLLMATLIHEFSHVNGYSDALDQANLTLPLSPVTANITIKLATDCFGYKGPAQ